MRRRAVIRICFSRSGEAKMNFGSDEYAWYSVMLDGMGKAKGLDFMKRVGAPAAAHPGRQQHHALATDARRASRRSPSPRAAGARRNIRKKARRSIIACSILIRQSPWPGAHAPSGSSARVDTVHRLDAVGRRADRAGAADPANHVAQRDQTDSPPPGPIKKEFVFVNPAFHRPQSERVDRVLPADFQTCAAEAWVP